MRSRDCGKYTAGSIETADSIEPIMVMIRNAKIALQTAPRLCRMLSREEVSLVSNGIEIRVWPMTTKECMLLLRAEMSGVVS